MPLRLLQVWLWLLAALTMRSDFAQPGALDSSFRAPLFPTNFASVCVLSDGKIYAIASTAQGGKLQRLNSDGSLDTTFSPRLAPNFSVVSIAREAAGSLLVAARIDDARNKVELLRVFENGDVDPAFHATAESSDYLLVSIIPRPDGKFWLHGYFQKVNDTARVGLARFQADGTLDNFFRLQTNVVSVPRIAPQAGGRLLVKAEQAASDMIWSIFLRVTDDGSVDPTFDNTNVGMPGFCTPFVDSADRILIAGYGFRPPNSRIVFWRLLPDGKIDPSFAEVASDGDISDIAIQPDGKIIVAGYFKDLNGIQRPRLARLHENGAVDETFDARAWAGDSRQQILGPRLQLDGRVLVWGVVTAPQIADWRYFLVRVWGDKYLRFNNASLNDGGQMSLQIHNTFSGDFLLERSTDLITWEVLNAVPSVGIDTRTATPTAFYRATAK